jgi:hypothetical protein
MTRAVWSQPPPGAAGAMIRSSANRGCADALDAASANASTDAQSTFERMTDPSWNARTLYKRYSERESRRHGRGARMSDQDLRTLLAELHTRLREARSLDPEARKMLATVSRDIENALASDDAGSVATEPVEALAVRFEADHPSLAGVLRQIMDTLGKAGI